MNKRGHVLNAVLLSVGLGYILQPAGDLRTFVTIAEVFVPVVLGALFPDVDTAFGKHRKTLHNLPVLAVIGAYPVYFGNLQWVWLGVVTHYVLDVLGTTRGIALLYPLWKREFDVPFGITVDSEYADLMTVTVTAVELAGCFLLLQYGTPLVLEAQQILGVQ
jgi:membrane-bound metal-dependent hydrolase YbcI (DUF457 family)